MLEIKVIVDAGNWEAQGVKEALGMLLERWGKSRVVEVREIPPEQIKMEVSGCGHYRGK